MKQRYTHARAREHVRYYKHFFFSNIIYNIDNSRVYHTYSDGNKNINIISSRNNNGLQITRFIRVFHRIHARVFVGVIIRVASL